MVSGADFYYSMSGSDWQRTLMQEKTAARYKQDLYWLGKLPDQSGALLQRKKKVHFLGDLKTPKGLGHKMA